MSKKKEFLEVEFLSSEIPEYIEGITYRNYEDYETGFLDLGWPRNKKEMERYINRIFYESEKYGTFHTLDKRIVKNVKDGKSRDYLNLTICCDDFGEPRTKKEAILYSFRLWMEYASEFYNRKDDEYDEYD
jgi:hypothetical protein